MKKALGILAASTLLATTATASGIEMGENGATTALQGGAFTGQADDLSAIEHNPAGLAQLDGFNFQVDLQLLNHDVTFQRQAQGFDPAAPSPLFNTVRNQAGIFPLPLAAASYSLNVAHRRLTLALGVFGPPAVGRFNFGEPNYAKDTATGRYLENPRKFAPQRYALISNDILIMFPSLSVGFEAHKKLLVGVSAELVLSTFKFRQAMYSGLSTPASPLDEDPVFDSLADISTTGRPGFTATLGALYKPLDWLSIGVSARLPTHVVSSGTLGITLGEAATSLNATVSGDQTDLEMNVPLQVRAGIHARPTARLGVNLDFVFEDWSAFQEILLTPRDMTLTIGGGAPQVVAPVHIPKHWKDSYSGRLGLSYDVIDLLTVHAGAAYETSAIPDATFSIDFAHPDRVFVTGGVTLHVKQFDVTAGMSFTPTVTKTITQSDQLLTNTDPSIPGSVIGAGIYTTGAWGAVLGVRGHFGGAEKAPAVLLAPEAAPAPVLTPAPAADAAPEAAPAPEDAPAP